MRTGVARVTRRNRSSQAPPITPNPVKPNSPKVVSHMKEGDLYVLGMEEYSVTTVRGYDGPGCSERYSPMVRGGGSSRRSFPNQKPHAFRVGRLALAMSVTRMGWRRVASSRENHRVPLKAGDRLGLIAAARQMVCVRRPARVAITSRVMERQAANESDRDA